MKDEYKGWGVRHINNVIEQTHVYEYLGKENDPLYNNIMYLKVNQSLPIPETNMQITKTRYGMYEIVSDVFHECYSSPQSLYERISALLNAISLRR
ncbi:hypothetical protein [Oceanobacillus sp. CF4.6]|uniref:hypothetical protein n=1 Tax=Oceanobacillus sp. CF4.6 TaxID=3373080 RepID=UPI003EE4A1F1